jgi:predicted phosphodiesterase
MVTHECPERLAHTHVHYYEKTQFPSITRQAFDTMFEIHKPELHIYGHWHKTMDRVIEGTRFICLGELNFIDLDI